MAMVHTEKALAQRTMRFLASFLFVFVAVAVGCGGPKYPSCENDDNCNADGHHGVCLNGTCVECRDDATCGAGKQCKAGACTTKEGYCDEKTTCPGGAPCTNHTCGEASVMPHECSDDKPCASGQRCENGHCVVPVSGGPGCSEFTSPLFDFESSTLREPSKQTLQRLAGCLTTGGLKGHRVLLTGHCDNRGEYEFNMGLGAERAEIVKNFLVAAGVANDKLATSSRGKLDATGTDEAGWEHDRRVDIEVR